MATAITLLFLVALIVFLSMVRPSSTYLGPAPVDRDRERLLGEVRSHC
jgi:hypothetical protein